MGLKADEKILKDREHRETCHPICAVHDGHLNLLPLAPSSAEPALSTVTGFCSLQNTELRLYSRGFMEPPAVWASESLPGSGSSLATGQHPGFCEK